MSEPEYGPPISMSMWGERLRTYLFWYIDFTTGKVSFDPWAYRRWKRSLRKAA